MKAILINRDGYQWDFPSLTAARPHIKPDRRHDYQVKTIGGEQVAVYDDRLQGEAGA